MRKFLSVTLTLILLLTMAVPALATTNDTEPTETRTVEDILNEYHEKSFAAELAEETGNPAAYSRGASSGKSLEEETVDELRAAGYEAYHVTSSNYDALEESLKTDFEEMGLDPNGSYIITISGEPSGNPRSIDPPTEDYYDDGGGSYFLYDYENTTYKMRHVTVTTDEDSSLASFNSVTLLAKQTVQSQLLSFTSTLLNTALYAGIDYVTAGYWGTLASIIGLGSANFPVGYEAQLTLNGSAHWTRKFTQVYQTAYGSWSSYSSVDYVVATITVYGHYYDTSILDFVYPHESYEIRRYSAHYSDSEWQKQQAAIGYEGGYRNNEYVGDVHVYEEPDNSNSRILLTVYQP